MRMRLIAAFLAASTVLATSPVSDSPVADAAMRGNFEQVRSLLEAGADVNAAQGDGMTALHWAAEAGRLQLARALLVAGANPDAATRIGDYTPLHLAARQGQAALVGALLEAGAQPSRRSTAGGARPLHFAAAAGSVASLQALLAAGADINAAEESRGQTPLIWAAAANRVEALRYLLEQGADPGVTTRVTDIPRRTELDRAASRRRSQVLAAFQGEAESRTPGWRPTPAQVQAALLAAEQNAVPEDEDSRPETVDYEERKPEALSYGDLVYRQGGLTALLHAAREGHAESVVALLRGGADIDQVSAGDGTSPLLIALINGHFDLALTLREHGANVNLASNAGTTPLFAALNTQWAPKSRYPQQQAYRQQQASYLDVMRALLQDGADPNIRLKKHLWYMSYTFDLLSVDVAGATPFWRAAYATDVEAMKLLAAWGAEPSTPTIKPVQRRRRRGSQPQSGADPSGLPPVPPGGPGVFPIHAASGVGYGQGYAGNAHRHVPGGWLPAVRYLVEEMGADVNARDHNGYTALHHAAARGDNELIRYLVSKGADVMVVSRRGQTTVDMANGPVQRIQPFPETIALLEGLGAVNNHNCVSC